MHRAQHLLAEAYGKFLDDEIWRPYVERRNQEDSCRQMEEPTPPACVTSYGIASKAE